MYHINIILIVCWYQVLFITNTINNVWLVSFSFLRAPALHPPCTRLCLRPHAQHLTSYLYVHNIQACGFSASMKARHAAENDQLGPRLTLCVRVIWAAAVIVRSSRRQQQKQQQQQQVGQTQQQLNETQYTGPGCVMFLLLSSTDQYVYDTRYTIPGTYNAQQTVFGCNFL